MTECFFVKNTFNILLVRVMYQSNKRESIIKTKLITTKLIFSSVIISMLLITDMFIKQLMNSK